MMLRESLGTRADNVPVEALGVATAERGHLGGGHLTRTAVAGFPHTSGLPRGAASGHVPFELFRVVAFERG